MPSNLRCVFAQCYRLCGTRSFSSSPPGKAVQELETIGVLLFRPVAGLTLGTFLGYCMFGGTASELDASRKQALREHGEFLQKTEKELLSYATRSCSSCGAVSDI